uniref:Nucleosome assembly protein 1 like 4 n=1 Tax=Sus scrofa TaxID=9823 RepID=A0A8D1PLK4_PIG
MADNSFSDGVPSESLEAAKNASNTEKLTDQVMQNPQVLAALQERLDSVSHTPSSYIETLPKAVKRRINALKQLQVKCAHIEAKFYEEVHDLERKYAALYQPLFDKRREFITGDVEPTDAESEWHSENEEEDKLAGDVKDKVVIAEKEAAAAEEPNPKGIPEFWFTIFRNVDMLSELVQEYDEPILKHLQDIKVKFSEPGQPMVERVLSVVSVSSTSQESRSPRPETHQLYLPGDCRVKAESSLPVDRSRTSSFQSPSCPPPREGSSSSARAFLGALFVTCWPACGRWVPFQCHSSSSAACLPACLPVAVSCRAWRQGPERPASGLGPGLGPSPSPTTEQSKVALLCFSPAGATCVGGGRAHTPVWPLSWAAPLSGVIQ